MGKWISIVIFSCGLFSLSNKVEASRELTPLEAFLCCTHERLGADSPASVFPEELLKDICSLTKTSLKIIDEDFNDFNALIEMVASNFVVILDLSSVTCITDIQLCRMLELVGHGLKKLEFWFECKYLFGFIATSSDSTATRLVECLVERCPVLEELDLGCNCIGNQSLEFIKQNMLERLRVFRFNKDIKSCEAVMLFGYGNRCLYGLTPCCRGLIPY